MTSSLFIALRYANPHNNERFLSFVSLIALLSIALGSAALIISLAVLYGFEDELRVNAVKFTSHIQVKGFNERPILGFNTRMQNIRDVIPNVKSISAYIEHHAMVRSPQFVDGVLVKGVVPEHDVSNLRINMREGDFAFSSPSAFEIVIGHKLARKLNAACGDRIVIYAINGEPSITQLPVIEEFRVVGIFETGMAEYDDLYVYIPFETAVTTFELPEEAASGFDIMVHDLDDIERTAGYVSDLMQYPYFTRTVFETYRAMFAWIELQKEPIPIVLGLISIVAVFNVLATLLMLVVEKIHSIGVLRSLGMRRRSIRRIFLLQGLGLGIVGTLSGCLLGFAICWIQAEYKIIALQGEIYFLDAVPIKFVAWHYAIVMGVCLSLCILATLFPAWIASRIDPVKALRFS